MRIRRALSTGCALALLLAACAGAGEDPGEAETPAASATTDEAPSEEATDDEAATEDADGAADADEPAMDDEEMMDDHDDAMGNGEDEDVVAGAEDVDRVVEIDMEDIKFSVEELEFTVGERVLFVFENVGAAPHEALIGDMHVQDEHEEEMMEGGGHHEDGGHHGELSMISLESGESGQLVHEFTEAGELWMGCHVPGHWGAGMRTRITVTG